MRKLGRLLGRHADCTGAVRASASCCIVAAGRTSHGVLALWLVSASESSRVGRVRFERWWRKGCLKFLSSFDLKFKQTFSQGEGTDQLKCTMMQEELPVDTAFD